LFQRPAFPGNPKNIVVSPTQTLKLFTEIN
jgi:hypothetical protein